MKKIKKEFYVGAATAAHQVEGNNVYSDYWALEHMKYGNFNEPSLDAVNHYHQYEEDIQLMVKAGLNAYRFSIEWARIEPKEGQFNQEEIEHYRKVLMCCRKNGIEPIVTMHHFTSPKWLIEKGGWEAEITVSYFANYCRYVAEQLGDLMHYVCTINEANMGIQVSAIAERYKRQMIAQMQRESPNTKKEDMEGTIQVGMNFSDMMANMEKQKEENLEIFGTKTPFTFVSARTHKGDILVMRAHQAAKRAMKEVRENLKIGLSLSLHDIQSQAGGEELAKKEWEEEFTHYIPYISEDDFFGLQNYSRTIIGSEGILPNPLDAKITQMGYENYPQALEHVIRLVHKEMPIPIIITENGIATENDRERVEFIRMAMEGVENCLKDGIEILGYMHWSLMDNFEWQKGYSMKFGLIEVDRITQKRTPKESLFALGEYAKGE